MKDLGLRSRLWPSLLVVYVSLTCISSSNTQTSLIARLPTTTRAEVVARAKQLAAHSWTCGSQNLHASCSRSYKSDWTNGQHVTGIPYSWGGVDGPELFDQKLAKGLAAGGHSRYGVLACTAGIDCSGFVTLCWGLPVSGHAYSTSNLRTIAGRLRANVFTDLKPGDVLNKPGSHVVLFTGYNPDGTLNICEASGSAARVICHRTTWSHVTKYIALQYKGIDD